MNIIRAVIFDFDGVILDTESPIYNSWHQILTNYGVNLPLHEWAKCLGTSSDAFDPIDYLRQHTAQPFDPVALKQEHRTKTNQMIAKKRLQPGVRNLLSTLKIKGIKTAIASSSPSNWVLPLLKKHGILTMFDAFTFGDEVSAVKPEPFIYQKTLEKLAITADQAIALEDSPNGISAAQAAGIYTLGIITPISQYLNISGADRIISHLSEINLETMNF